MTERFREALLVLSAATAHEAAQRLAHLLHLPTAVTTLRRQLEKQQPPVREDSTTIGLDDFAFRKGKTYGTVIVDLESHQVVDLLEDRSSATVETGLRAHPHICVLSRDRAGEYAQAADHAAPQAVQIADRFHLLLNGGECLERFIQRHPTLLHDTARYRTIPQRRLCRGRPAAVPPTVPPEPGERFNEWSGIGRCRSTPGKENRNQKWPVCWGWLGEPSFATNAQMRFRTALPANVPAQSTGMCRTGGRAGKPESTMCGYSGKRFAPRDLADRVITLGAT
jgi:hypothetical protein